MGCVSSKEDTLSVTESKKSFTDAQLETLSSGVSNYLPNFGPLTAKDYKERLISSEGTQTIYLPHAGYTLRYAYVSQRGYYPDARDKANQDSYCVHTQFGGDPDQMFFGVFDGHGEWGTQCSQFAKDKVPENFVSNSHFAVSPEIAYHQAMVLSNNQLHRNEVDDTMSGTTAITVLMRGRTVYVANVGDSRAVLAERHGDKIVACDLSYDQTPYRRDECERVKRAGARVLTLDQLEGLKDPTVECWGTEEDDDGDPPRLWAQNGTYPGTAFTRSIGDSAAERIGVFAEPEVVTKQLTASHPFIIIASDGVFEFLPSQSVVDMVCKFEDPQEACFSVVAESYRLWLQHETRTDDITMIVIQIQGLEDEAPQLAMPTPMGPPWEYSTRATPAQLGLTSKPLYKQPLPSIEGAFSTQEDEEVDSALSKGTVATFNTRKTAEDYALLTHAVKGNFLLGSLDDTTKQAVFDAMEKWHVHVGDIIVRQGERGDHFFVVHSGAYDVFVNNNGVQEHVHTYSAVGGFHPSFGELALLYGKPRAATVVARTDGVLWALQRKALKTVLQRKETRSMVKVLRNVEVLQSMTLSQLQVLTDLMTEVSCNDGDVIIRQGEEGQDFYILQHGEVVCTVRKNPHNLEEEPKEVLRLGSGQYFGERALLSSARRAANVVAGARVQLLTISRATFEATFGPLQDMLEAESNWKERLVAQREIISRKPAVGSIFQGNFSMEDLDARGLLYATDCSALLLMEHRNNEEIHTVRVTSVADAVAHGKQAMVLRARDVTRTLEPSLFVPGVLKSFKDNRVLAEVLMTNALCTLDMLLTPLPFDEASAAYVAASVVLALEHLHWAHIIYRGLACNTVVVTEGGNIQLVDFRFSRKNEGRTYTICGNPEYMAPEMLECRGHTEAVDWWALGVLIYHLLAGETPFAKQGDDELRIYRRILGRSLAFPASLSPLACDLIDHLLARNPLQRLGVGVVGLKALKAHPWFASQGVHWTALSEHRLANPQGIRERIYNFEGVSCAHFDPLPHEGDVSWINNF